MTTHIHYTINNDSYNKLMVHAENTKLFYHTINIIDKRLLHPRLHNILQTMPSCCIPISLLTSSNYAFQLHLFKCKRTLSTGNFARISRFQQPNEQICVLLRLLPIVLKQYPYNTSKLYKYNQIFYYFHFHPEFDVIIDSYMLWFYLPLRIAK